MYISYSLIIRSAGFVCQLVVIGPVLGVQFSVLLIYYDIIGFVEHLISHFLIISYYYVYTNFWKYWVFFFIMLNYLPLFLQGRFEILSLSGSFMPTDSGGTRSRSGGMSVSLASPDGRVVGGGVAGLLVAASPVQACLLSLQIIILLLFKWYKIEMRK